MADNGSFVLFLFLFLRRQFSDVSLRPLLSYSVDKNVEYTFPLNVYVGNFFVVLFIIVTQHFYNDKHLFDEPKLGSEHTQFIVSIFKKPLCVKIKFIIKFHD